MILAIDTATRMLSVALVSEVQILGEHTWTTANQHSVELVTCDCRLFKQTDMSPQDLTAIAVAQGPGSFTGVRIGMACGKRHGVGITYSADSCANPRHYCSCYACF